MRISGFTTPIARSSARDISSRSVTASTQRLMILAAIFRLRVPFTGPMPQPYIRTRFPASFARRMLQR